MKDSCRSFLLICKSIRGFKAVHVRVMVRKNVNNPWVNLRGMLESFFFLFMCASETALFRREKFEQ